MRPETHSRVRRDTAREILRYFVSHPAAKDTLEGIAKWWLDRQRIERGVDEVAESLRLLVARGFVTEQLARAGQPFYQMNPARRKEITQFLDEAELDPSGMRDQSLRAVREQ